ncbi:hypothetical protein GO495_25740 [Chitinophaga oryziterrae]|uniref:Uncharacterized protein n=1 Tax=Chitinophaga oryziterrae TaxID=1031224 RepID=A0A6N8JGE5_9BACT|nr:hypothetical protein [Chitinophaga oryziterrae]MVT44024.1 hypothetical protein [Chitinophaga oryziterrae]
MGKLQEDIKSQSDWIVKAFASDGYNLDYTIDSFIQIDLFFKHNMKDGKPIKGGRLPTTGFGPVLFSIGAYVGETIINHIPGAVWITDDDDPEGEMKISIKFPNGAEIWPINKIFNRFRNGSEDSIYPYGYILSKDFTEQEFNQKFWALTAETKKSWWAFWKK